VDSCDSDSNTCHSITSIVMMETPALISVEMENVFIMTSFVIITMTVLMIVAMKTLEIVIIPL